MKKLILLSLIIFCSVLMLCNYTIAQDDGTAAPDSTIIVNKGDSFSIVLESNKTTGYSWQLGSNSDSNIVHFLITDYNTPSTDMPGQGGEEVWTFKTESTGTVTIILQYLRPWENDTPPARIKIYSIVVQ
ncbi:MAG: protease inhibitor I42 family protein [Ignavibacteriae bacterium]|nr:protease inhibitor I42 family protein [Ignavibacteriota bacterium]